MEAERYLENGRGKIKIQPESPYEHLDQNTLKWLQSFKQMWTVLKKCDGISKNLFDFFSKSENPFKSVLQIMIMCGDFYSGKQNSLAFNIMEGFSNWLIVQDPSVFQVLDETLKLDAFNLVIRQNNYALISLVVNVYKMLENNELFLESIRDLIESNRYKEACQCADLLQLHTHFKIDDFLIPLVFQDKYNVAEPFLHQSKEHQVQLTQFLDDLLGKKNIAAEAESIVLKLNINMYNSKVMYHKPLSKLVARLVTTFNLPPSTCPNLALKRGKGAVQFLLHQRYVKGAIGLEGWTEMVLEAVGDDKNLQTELVEGVALYGDLKEALSWAERFGTPEDSWPFKLKEFNGRHKNSANYPGWEESWDESQQQAPVLKFHQLPFPESEITVIDTASGFGNFLNYLSSEVSLIGFDAEWKPTFGVKKCDIALIQVATCQNIFILDMIALNAIIPSSLWKCFVTALLANPNILKLGYGVNQDLVLIKESLRKLHGVKTADEGFLDMAALWKSLVCDHGFIFPFSSNSDSHSSRSLSTLIELCLGEKLDKSDQFSNWENRPLRKSQIVYAALDAYCLLEAYEVMQRECKSQGIAFSEVIDEVMNELTPKTMERRKKRNL